MYLEKKIYFFNKNLSSHIFLGTIYFYQQYDNLNKN